MRRTLVPKAASLVLDAFNVRRPIVYHGNGRWVFASDFDARDATTLRYNYQTQAMNKAAAAGWFVLPGKPKTLPWRRGTRAKWCDHYPAVVYRLLEVGIVVDRPAALHVLPEWSHLEVWCDSLLDGRPIEPPWWMHVHGGIAQVADYTPEPPKYPACAVCRLNSAIHHNTCWGCLAAMEQATRDGRGLNQRKGSDDEPR